MRKRFIWLAGVMLALLWPAPAKAQNRFIIRTTLAASALQTACNPPLLPSICNVVEPIGDPTSQVFLITSSLDLNSLLNLTGNPLGLVDAEVDQLLNLVGGLNVLPSPLPAGTLQDRTIVAYPAGSSTMVWDGYANQPAASIVRVQDAQSTFKVQGSGIVADIDTGVDPNHPVLKNSLVPGCGYDFTRNQACGNELNDITPTDFPAYPPPTCSTCQPAKVNQSTAAVLDQSTAAVLDGTKYAAFGHGTMVLGIVHLVAPTAQLMPLKAFHSDGTGYLSDILRAIYYAVKNNANVINMSFDFTSSSTELQKALDYANQQGLVSGASAGNEGQGPSFLVYPAALQSDVMGVASVGSTPSTDSTRSSFSNYGDSLVWLAAPGENIVSTYPFDTYAAGWGTSFSAPFVSGGGSLLRNVHSPLSESQAAGAVAHAQPLSGQGLGNGRLDLCQALGTLSSGTTCSPQDYSVSSSPSSGTLTAGQKTTFTVTATPASGFVGMVTWSCSGAPAASTCTVSPSSVPLDGMNAANATVTFSTVARTVAPPLVLPPTVLPQRFWLIAAACCACVALFLLLCGLGRAPRLRFGPAATAGLLAISLCCYACGGYNSGGGGGGGGGSAATLSSLSLNPTSVTGGSSSMGTVTLSGAAPSSGAMISLSSNNSAATVPASVSVPSGATSATFTVKTTTVTASTSVTITATYGAYGGAKTAMLTVTPGATAGTPAGTYTLTVTGTSGSASHSSTFRVTVN